MAFPSPVGGTLIKEDFAPSIVFAILYGLLVPLAAFRFLRKESRTVLLIGVTTFSIERVVIFSLRANQSGNVEKAASAGLASYEQVTLGLGYIGMCDALIGFLRALLVNSTRPEANGDQEHTNPTPQPDRPRERFWYRRLADFLSWGFLGATVSGLISGSIYSKSINSSSSASHVMVLRYVSSGLAFLMLMHILLVALVATRSVRRINKSAVYILMGPVTLLATVALYRLAVMHNTTDSLLSRGPGSLSSPSAKALFYIFHVVPEWTTAALILGLNSRGIFNTGPFGDWRATDPKPKPEDLEKSKSLESLQESVNVSFRG
ncbi:hypothetical protein K439DRAFT_1625004 [Ramaria rubella]|nr:hypothetical protein K439DRAFT_1625004 [Ramaria rubella]